MSVCTFFGHRECPDSVKPKLKDVLIELHTNYGVDLFYVGNQGRFDAIVRSTLRELRKEYPSIKYAVVLAYLPEKQSDCDAYSDTMLPEGIEYIYPRYTLSWRNNWMLHESNFVVTYIVHSWGGAAKYATKAMRKGKNVINIADHL